MSLKVKTWTLLLHLASRASIHLPILQTKFNPHQVVSSQHSSPVIHITLVPDFSHILWHQQLYRQHQHLYQKHQRLYQQHQHIIVKHHRAIRKLFLCPQLVLHSEALTKVQALTFWLSYHCFLSANQAVTRCIKHYVFVLLLIVGFFRCSLSKKIFWGWRGRKNCIEFLCRLSIAFYLFYLLLFQSFWNAVIGKAWPTWSSWWAFRGLQILVSSPFLHLSKWSFYSCGVSYEV